METELLVRKAEVEQLYSAANATSVQRQEVHFVQGARKMDTKITVIEDKSRHPVRHLE